MLKGVKSSYTCKQHAFTETDQVSKTMVFTAFAYDILGWKYITANGDSNLGLTISSFTK